MGHENLESVLRSIVVQEILPRTIVVVDNSKFGVDSTLEKFKSMVDLIVIKKENQSGAADAYNMAFSAIHDLGLNKLSEFVAIASDDDIWLENKIALQKLYANEKCIVSGRVIQNNFRKQSIRPKIGIKPRENPLDYLYSHPLFIMNPRFLALSSALIPVDLINIKFKSSLKAREDLIWLFEVWSKGYKHIQINKPLVKYEVNYFKSSNRDSLIDAIEFNQKYLKSLNSNYFWLYYIRPIVAAGEISKLRYQIREIRSFSSNIDIKVRLLFFVYELLCFSIKLSKIAMRKKLFLWNLEKIN